MAEICEINVQIVVSDVFTISTILGSQEEARSPVEETLRLRPLLEATVLPTAFFIEPNRLPT